MLNPNARDYSTGTRVQIARREAFYALNGPRNGKCQEMHPGVETYVKRRLSTNSATAERMARFHDASGLVKSLSVAPLGRRATGSEEAHRDRMVISPVFAK